METLDTILRDLRKHLHKPKARCTLISEGGADETSLLATRHGLLRLAEMLIDFVHRSDIATAQGVISDDQDRLQFDSDKDAFWTGNIKHLFHQLPVNSSFIIGCYCFSESERLIDALEEFTRQDMSEGMCLRNDPDFSHPE